MAMGNNLTTRRRFVIIADYPKLAYRVGKILTQINEGSSVYDCEDMPSSEVVQHPEEYPHLFNELYWYDKRDLDKLPTHVKHVDGNGKAIHVIKVEKYIAIKENSTHWWCFEYKIDEFPFETRMSLSDWLPATEEEYNDFKANTNEPLS